MPKAESRLPSAEEVRLLEDAASQELRTSFGLRLGRKDFDDALRKTREHPDLLGRPVPLSLPRPPPPGESMEQIILRLFVETHCDEVWIAGAAALQTLRKALAELPDVALQHVLDRTRQAVGRKFDNKDVARGPFDRAIALDWTERLARQHAEPVAARIRLIVEKALAACPQVDQEVRVGSSPDRWALTYFGIRVSKDILDVHFPDRQQDDRLRLIALLWLCCGRYRFGRAVADEWDDLNLATDRIVRVVRKGVVERRMEGKKKPETSDGDDVPLPVAPAGKRAVAARPAPDPVKRR